MSIYSALSHLAAEWRTAREEARTRRIVDSSAGGNPEGYRMAGYPFDPGCRPPS